MLSVYVHYIYIFFYFFHCGIVFRRQNLTSKDAIFWRLKTVPALKGLSDNFASRWCSYRTLKHTEIVGDRTPLCYQAIVLHCLVTFRALVFKKREPPFCLSSLLWRPHRLCWQLSINHGSVQRIPTAQVEYYPALQSQKAVSACCKVSRYCFLTFHGIVLQWRHILARGFPRTGHPRKVRIKIPCIIYLC